jgi:hypothetical protein
MDLAPGMHSMEALMQKALAAVIITIAVAGPALEAQARIICRDGFQKVNGQEISTPYCRDEYLAAVARSYGSRVSGKDVRNSASLKYELCRFIGHDIRVQDHCPQDSDTSRDR